MCFAHRWVIEEYHKCLYSGCAVFARQLTTAVGWRASPRIFSNCGEGCFYNCVCSVALSQNVWLFPVIPPLLLQVLVARLGLFSVELTLGQFWSAIFSSGWTSSSQVRWSSGLADFMARLAALTRPLLGSNIFSKSHLEMWVMTRLLAMGRMSKRAETVKTIIAQTIMKQVGANNSGTYGMVSIGGLGLISVALTSLGSIRMVWAGRTPKYAYQKFLHQAGVCV